MIDLLFKILWFLLPAGAANLVPPLAAKLFPNWATPIDFNLTFRGQRIFGPHKTIRGLIFGILFSTLTLEFQLFLGAQWTGLHELFVSIDPYKLWWLGPYFGLCALGGDLIKSFFKRQFSIQPGHSWFPWDQVDWIMGTLAGTYWLFKFNIIFILFALILGLILSIAAKIIGYWMGINKAWI